MRPEESIWTWRDQSIGWSFQGPAETDEADTSKAQGAVAVLLVHGFGANTNHWRFNQPVLAELTPTYAIDLIGFGRSEQLRNQKISTRK